jgi:hypothetical protein
VNPGIPPRAERLLRWSLSPLERPAILGDLEEEFASICASGGLRDARRWYRRQVRRSVGSNLWRRFHNDDRRRVTAYRSLPTIALGLVYVAEGLWSRSPRRPAWLVTVGGLLAFLGVAIVVAAFLRKRLDPPPAERRVALWVIGGTTAAGVVVAFLDVLPPGNVWLLTSIAVGVLVIWPWPGPTRPSLHVAPKGSDAIAASLWSTDVPSGPLALSGLVLHRASTRKAGEPGRPLTPPIIARQFTATDRLRVRAVVNLAGSVAEASVELLDRHGRQVWHASVPLMRDGLVEIPASLDDIADRDPAEDFGLVDADVSLAGLAPGVYRLRVNVTDGTRTSCGDESLTVTT